MKDKVIKKLVAVFMLVVTFFSTFSNIVFAKKIGDEAYLEKKGDCGHHLQYWKEEKGLWSYINCTYVTYNENGKEYPAYCLNRDAHGVGEVDNYSVDLTQVLDDVRIWRTIINAYPYKSPEQLGVENEYDAFVATKQAVYCIIYDWDAASRFRGADERGTKIANAIVNLSNIGKNGTQTPYNSGVSASKVNGLMEDGEYYSQKFKINCGVDIQNYSVIATNGLPSGAKITDIDNNETNNINGNSNFKIKIPKNSMNSDINITFSIKTSAKTYPIFYGKTRIDGTQNYAITTDSYEDITGNGSLNIATNTGRIEINKTDDETHNPIENVTFGLYKKNGTEIARATTNSQGIATFQGLYQNSYVLKELSTNSNYVLNKVDFDVNVEYNKQTKLDIENEHKKGNLKIYKVDKDNNKIGLGNVTFDLYSEELEKVIGSYTTNVDGEIYIEQIRTGNYKLIEKNSRKMV